METKMLRTKLRMVLVVLGLIASFGCGDESEDPYERTSEAREIVSDAQLARFETLGVPIYGGSSPPDIAGTYYYGDAAVDYTDSKNYPAFTQWCHTLDTYKLGGSDFVYDHSYVGTNGCNTSGLGQASFISGTRDCFTLYSHNRGTFQGCYKESIKVISACLNSSGDFVAPVTASLVVEQAAGSACDGLTAAGNTLALGESSVTSLADGFARRVNN